MEFWQTVQVRSHRTLAQSRLLMVHCQKYVDGYEMPLNCEAFVPRK